MVFSYNREHRFDVAFERIGGSIKEEFINLVNNSHNKILIVDGDLTFGCDNDCYEALKSAIERGVKCQIFCGPWFLDDYRNNKNGNKFIKYLSEKKPKNVLFARFKNFLVASPFHFAIDLEEVTSLVETSHYPSNEYMDNGFKIVRSTFWIEKFRKYISVLSQSNPDIAKISLESCVDYLKTHKELFDIAAKLGDFWKKRPALIYQKLLRVCWNKDGDTNPFKAFWKVLFKSKNK